MNKTKCQYFFNKAEMLALQVFFKNFWVWSVRRQLNATWLEFLVQFHNNQIEAERGKPETRQSHAQLWY